ncbi:MAG: hypothetical protein WC360_08745, partial [Opitutales bacterium]
MSRIQRRIHSAHWTSSTSGIVSLTRDWTKSDPPPLFWDNPGQPLEQLQKAPLREFGDVSGYYTQGSMVTFCLRASRYPNFDLERCGVYVAGEFNGWDPGFGGDAWRLAELINDGQQYYVLDVPKQLCYGRGKVSFKFISGRGEWMEVPTGAPNITMDADGNHNLYIHPHRTGHHQFTFRPPAPLDHSSGPSRVIWAEDGYEESAHMMPGEYLHEVDSRYEQGVFFADGNTVFRIFAPRASSVRLSVFRNPDHSDAVSHDAARVDMGTWEAVLPQDCDGAYYFYYISGEPDPFSN